MNIIWNHIKKCVQDKKEIATKKRNILCPKKSLVFASRLRKKLSTKPNLSQLNQSEPTNPCNRL